MKGARNCRNEGPPGRRKTAGIRTHGMAGRTGREIFTPKVIMCWRRTSALVGGAAVAPSAGSSRLSQPAAVLVATSTTSSSNINKIVLVGGIRPSFIVGQIQFG